jgi:hypothetical protein
MQISETVIPGRCRRVRPNAGPMTGSASNLETMETWIASAAAKPRIPDGFSQHGVELALGEFLGLRRCYLARHLLCHRAGTGSQRRHSLRYRPYPGFCCRRLVTTFQAQTSQLRTDRVTAISEAARDLLGALSYGPEFFEQRYVFRIPTHGRYYTPIAGDRLVVAHASSAALARRAAAEQPASLRAQAKQSRLCGLLRRRACHRARIRMARWLLAKTRSQEMPRNVRARKRYGRLCR